MGNIVEPTSTSHSPRTVLGGQDKWQEIALVHYPSMTHFCDMLGGEDYQAINEKFRLPVKVSLRTRTYECLHWSRLWQTLCFLRPLRWIWFHYVEVQSFSMFMVQSSGPKWYMVRITASSGYISVIEMFKPRNGWFCICARSLWRRVALASGWGDPGHCLAGL